MSAYAGGFAVWDISVAEEDEEYQGYADVVSEVDRYTGVVEDFTRLECEQPYIFTTPGLSVQCDESLSACSFTICQIILA